MVAYFRSFQPSVLGQLVSIVCVMMVCSYILFEVLDLDGSNFLPRYPIENAAIVSEAEANVFRPYLTRFTEPWPDVFSSLPTNQIAYVHPHLIRPAVIPSSHLLRRCRSRVALPRSSVPDPFPVLV